MSGYYCPDCGEVQPLREGLVNCRECGRIGLRPVEPCIGGCGRVSDGVFRDGTHGPGTYCGWCDAIPATA